MRSTKRARCSRKSATCAGLRGSGVLPAGAQRTAFTLKVRDPGRELDGATDAVGPAGDWPLTLPVTSALAAAASSTGGKPLQGVLLDPYRNYRGAEVIGAWRWLPEERMGIVAEIGIDEAYAPLRYVRATVAAILALLVLTAGWAAWSTLALARLAGRPAAGRRIGAYRLEGELAEGGMATIHLAHHALLKRPTAIKILKRHLATDELAARFEREVRLVSELSHPNTIEIYDYGQTADGLFYYAMEFVDGTALDALVGEDGALPPGRIRHIALQVCASLGEVHGKGMVHRDIKPQNVMICERGGVYDFVKVLDFGIVKRIEAASAAYPDAQRALTRQVRLLGTPAYMAPERVGAPSDVDPRSDVYGVGALVFFLASARAPFDGTDEADILRDVLSTPAPRLSAVVPAIPAALDELVARCLAKKPGDRPATIGEVAAALESLDLPPWTMEEARRWWEAWRERHAGRPATYARTSGSHLALEPCRLVLEQELAPLHAAHGELVVRGIALEPRDGGVEVAMLHLDRDEALLERHAIGVADVALVAQSVPTAAASSTSARRRWYRLVIQMPERMSAMPAT